MISLATRILPFIATFALGLFLASFFVALSVPKFKYERRYEYRNECNYQRVKRENWRRQHRQREYENYENQLVPPPPMVAPVAPTIPYTLQDHGRGSGGGYGSGSSRPSR